MQLSPHGFLDNIDRQFAQLLFMPYVVLIFLPVLVVSTHLIGFLTIILLSLGITKLARKLPSLWAKINAKSALSRVNIVGTEHIDLKQSYIIVANHRSHFDVLALYGWLDIDFRWVMKQELRKVPALGITCEKLGHVFIDRDDKDKARQSIQAAKHEICNGTSILFFPEGKRSNEAEMLPFKYGAFKLAKELELPILPVTINGSGSILPPNTVNLLPGSVELVVHKPISSKEYTGKQLSFLAREEIASSFNRD